MGPAVRKGARSGRYAGPSRRLRRQTYIPVVGARVIVQILLPPGSQAYAKAHGSYAAIHGGHIAEALLDLTGAPTETVLLDADGFDSEETWARMCSWADAEFPIGCATAYDRSLKQVGLVGTHAYSVLEVTNRTWPQNYREPSSTTGFDGLPTCLVTWICT